MSKEMAVIALGAFVVVLPYLGIYSSWRIILLVIVGLVLMVLGFLLRGEAISREHRHGEGTHKRSRATFAENAAHIEQDYTAPQQDHLGSLN